jgi:hypothetical protein
MIKLLPLLTEKSPCWKGYKQIGMKEKDGKQVPNCVPINEEEFASRFEDEDEYIEQYVDTIQHLYPNGITISKVQEEIPGPISSQFRILIELAKKGLLKMSGGYKVKPEEVEKILDDKFDIALNTNLNTNLNEEEIDEYDVENEQDLKEFIQFMKEYQQHLSEAECDCVYEAEYHGRKVSLGKPMQGDIKKFKVYVNNNKGKVVKVNFGFGGKSAHGKRMVIKRNNPVHRNAYRKRHHCDNPGPRDKANYWSCRKW